MSLWQTQSWQDMLMASGQTQEYFVIERDFQTENKQKIFVEKRKVSLGEYGLFVIGFEGIIDENVGENLQELCAEENCLFVQVETLDYVSAASFLPLGENGMREVAGENGMREVAGENGMREVAGENGMRTDLGENLPAFAGMTQKYYKKFIPPYTAVIDLTQSEEDILAAMKPKGRYNIKVASKNGVQVKQVWKSKENIQKFYDLMQETTSRDNFFGNTLGYYQKFLQQEHTQLFFAQHEDDLIAAGIFIQDKETMYYYYGASSSQKRNLMAPYLLQWTVIQHAKSLGCSLYDFLGIAAPDEKDSPLAGVTDFKLKLTPDTRKVSESFLSIHKKWKYTAIQFLKNVRKK